MNPQQAVITAGFTTDIFFAVAPPKPIARFTYAINKQTVNVNASGTIAQPNALYEWSWGDYTIDPLTGTGIVRLDPAGPVASHTYIDANPRHIALNVSDAGGTGVYTQSIQLVANPPSPTTTPVPVQLGRMAVPWNTYMIYAPGNSFNPGNWCQISSHSAVPSINGVPYYVGGTGSGLLVLFKDAMLTPLVVTTQGTGGTVCAPPIVYPKMPIVSAGMTANGNTYQIRVTTHGLATGNKISVAGHSSIPSLTNVPLWVKVITADFVTVWKDVGLTQVVTITTAGVSGTIQRV